MPIRVTHTLADLHVTYREHTFELPDRCPSCNTRLAEDEVPLLREVNFNDHDIESTVSPDGEIEPTDSHQTCGETFYPVALYCPNCPHAFAQGEETVHDA